LVSTNPQPGEAESITTSEAFFNFPALPVKESNVVVTGVVLGSKAHLSANKKGVFSEFKIAMQSVFKKTGAEILEGIVIAADRIGGHVKYPNGPVPALTMHGLPWIVTTTEPSTMELSCLAISLHNHPLLLVKRKTVSWRYRNTINL
jgi:hypothetical protein